MAIVVVGGGAIGLLVAGRLAQASQPTAVLARPNVAKVLNAQQLRITQDNHTRHIDNLVVVPEPSALPRDYQQPELAILCVKGYDTTSALSTLTMLQPAMVLTLQNGIGNEETLAARFGADCVLSGAITSSVEMHAPDNIMVMKSGSICLAPVGTAQSASNSLSRWATTLRAANFNVREYDDYRDLKWSKALLNMLGNATSAILDLPVKTVYANPRLVALERRAFLEGVAVMEHIGVRIVNLPGYPAALLATLMQKLPMTLLWPLMRQAIAGGRGGKDPSLQRDLRQRRTRSEGDYLYGAVARTASEVGMSAPVNAVLWYVLNGIATGALPWYFFRRHPERLLDMVGM